MFQTCLNCWILDDFWNLQFCSESGSHIWIFERKKKIKEKTHLQCVCICVKRVIQISTVDVWITHFRQWGVRRKLNMISWIETTQPIRFKYEEHKKNKRFFENKKKIKYYMRGVRRKWRNFRFFEIRIIINQKNYFDKRIWWNCVWGGGGKTNEMKERKILISGISAKTTRFFDVGEWFPFYYPLHIDVVMHQLSEVNQHTVLGGEEREEEKNNLN